jgi:hypothetical protein
MFLRNIGTHLQVHTASQPRRLGLTETRCEDVDWVKLAQDKDRWRVVVNTVMNFGVSYKVKFLE